MLEAPKPTMTTLKMESPKKLLRGKVGYYNRIYFNLPEDIQIRVESFLGIRQKTTALQNDTIKLLKTISWYWSTRGNFSVNYDSEDEDYEDYEDDKIRWLGRDMSTSIRGRLSFQFSVHDQRWCECFKQGDETREGVEVRSRRYGSYFEYPMEPTIIKTEVTKETLSETITVTTVSITTPKISTPHRKPGKGCYCHLINNSTRLYHSSDYSYDDYVKIQVSPIEDYTYDPRINQSIADQRAEEWRDYKELLERGTCEECHYLDRTCECAMPTAPYLSYRKLLYRNDSGPHSITQSY